MTQAGKPGDTQQPSLSFWDFLDVINPLQHIPLVSTLYRAITGDEISAPARIAGGTLFTGPVGFIASLANALVEEISGKDISETVLAMVSPATPTSPPSSPPSPPSPSGLAGSPVPPAKADPVERIGRPSLAALDSPVMPAAGLVLAAQRAAESALVRPPSRNGNEHDEAERDEPGVPRSSPSLSRTGDPGSWFTAAMMDGLKKYEALARANRPQSSAAFDFRG